MLKNCKQAMVVLLGVLLTACGGGGGGGGGANVLPTPVTITIPDLPISTTMPAEIFEANQEFMTSEVLGTIGAQYAYERGGTGDGIVVAVIDSGFDTTHPDLVNRIDMANSINIADDRKDTLYDYAGHGTAVAGLINAGGNDCVAIT